MPGRRWDLGLGLGLSLPPGLWGPVAVLVAAAVVVLEARRRWRKAVARSEEVRRMAWAAAAEAERAEFEASSLAYVAAPAFAYVAPAPEPAVVSEGGGKEKVVRPKTMKTATPTKVLPPECAACGSPTTKLCSRCKAIRYCSGKCQIIHWRQGHKDECHPPRADDHDDAQDCGTISQGVQSDGSELHDNSLETEGKSQIKPDETDFDRISSESNPCDLFSEDGSREVKSSMDTSGTESVSDSFGNSSSSLSGEPSISSPLMTPKDVTANEEPHQEDKAAEVFSSDFSRDGSRAAAKATNINPTEVSPSEFAGAKLPADSLSGTNNLEQKASSVKSVNIECRSDGRSFSSSEDCTNVTPTNVAPSEDAGECEGDCIQLDPETASPSSAKLSEHGTHPEKSPANGYSSNRISSEGTNHPSNVWPLKSRSLGSMSSFSSVDHGSSGGGRLSVSHNSSSKTEIAPKAPKRLPESNGSVSNGLYESVKKVYQQIKSSQVSRYHSSLSGNDISQKYKMLFPYDLFVKLYNSDKVDLRPCGLTNCGNSCYANVVLQCLAFTRPLTSYLLQGFHSKTCPKKEWCFMCEFESLLLKAKQGQSPLSPIGILTHINNIGSNLGHGKQEDAHEFLRYAIDTMQSTCLREAGTSAFGRFAEETTLVQLIFGGYLRSKIKCTRCQGKSERNERMMDLTVEIHGDIETLEEALTRFTATEVLEGENKYQCNRCKSYQRAKKKLTVLEAPNVLTITLKRFQSGKFGKLNKAVRFPAHLNLAPYMSATDDKSPVYTLYAVVVHQDIMNASFSGHYVCYVKNTQGKWYKANDSKVKPVELDNVLKKNAYMLLYARCSPRAPSLIRNALIRSTTSHHPKPIRSRHKEGIVGSHDGLSPHSMENSSQAEQRRNRDHYPPYFPSHHQDAGFRPSDLFDERFRNPRGESSSDSSSLLSCSDEGSCSTESSTRGSTSTDYSEHLYGDSGHWNSPWGKYFEDVDGFYRTPLITEHPSEAVSSSEALSYEEDMRGWERRVVGLEGEGRNPLFLYSDTTNCRKLTEESCSCRDCAVKDGVSMRRSSTTRERRGQTFC